MRHVWNPSIQRSRAYATTRYLVALAASLAGLATSPAHAQPTTDTILRISLSAGRSLPITTVNPVTKVAVANPEIADVIVVTERDIVINGKTNGETDVVLWSGDRPRVHYRVSVRPPSDRKMVLLAVKLAEVRKEMLTELGVSSLYRSKDGNTRVGTGLFQNDRAVGAPGASTLPSQASRATLPNEVKYLTILSDFGTSQFLALLEAEQQDGRARLLAEPNLLAADRDSASFLAGGEIPIPVMQGYGNNVAGGGAVTIQYREFGIMLSFSPDIVSDSIIKLRVRPEVSSLDYSNAVLLNGFRIPALRTRRVESTVDIRRDQSIILSGLFNDEREKVKAGIPFLMNIPILGYLFSSTRWQSAESELLVIVTPTIIDPAAIDGQLVMPIQPADRTPAIDALRKRLPADTTKKP